MGETINLLREYTEERRVLPARDIDEETESEEEEIIDNYAANQLTERVTLVRDNSEGSRIPGTRLSSSSKESLPPAPPLEARPCRERLLVLREGPRDNKETPSDSGDSELEEGGPEESAFPLSQTPPLFDALTQLHPTSPSRSVGAPPREVTSHSPLSWQSLSCDKVERNLCCMGEAEGAHRMSVTAGYVPGINHGGNSDLGRGYESMESLTESRCRELEL